ncbi:MAG TPA: hypothetical protein VIH61_01170 [Waddliaceae bacterium]
MKKIFSNYVAFLVIVLGISTQCFAVQNLKMTNNQSLASDNYYVQPGGVYVAPNEIFVLIENRLIQVYMLCSDERGVFVPGSEMTRQFVWCPICEHWYDPDQPHYCK